MTSRAPLKIGPVRIVGAVATFIAYFILLAYLPANIGGIASYAGIGIDISSIIRINQNLPIVGVIIAAAAAGGVLFRGSRLAGVFSIIMGLALILYIYLILNGGIVELRMPEGIVPNLSLKVMLDMTTLMYLFMIPPLLIVVKGIVKLTRP